MGGTALKLILKKFGRKLNFQHKSLSLSGRIKKIVFRRLDFAHCIILLQAYQEGKKVPKNRNNQLGSSWEANSSSTSQEFSSILWNQQVYHCIHQNKLLSPNLNIHNPVHSPLFISLELILVLFCHISLGLASGLFSLALLHTKNTTYLSPVSYALHSPPHYFTTSIFGEEYKSWGQDNLQINDAYVGICTHRMKRAFLWSTLPYFTLSL
jgi:hypothetical protein